jgi:hypothetical protein
MGIVFTKRVNAGSLLTIGRIKQEAMATMLIDKQLKEKLKKFFKSHKKVDLTPAYLFYLENQYHIAPVLFPKEKKIYQNKEILITLLEKKHELWRETEIKVQFEKESVNEETRRVYICPFTGKVFGDNTHPNPQDAIYDWVSKCKENTERVGGMKVKRFFVSEDPEVIKNYIKERKEPIIKTVFSSAVTGKLFNSKRAVIDDFIKNQIKPLTLMEVQNQNRFELEESFLEFIKTHFQQEKIQEFVEALSEEKEFVTHVERWVE